MERPFYILGHKYISYNSFYAHAGLRIECWDKYEGYEYTPSVSIGIMFALILDVILGL